MTGLGTIDPDRIRVFDCYLKDIWILTADRVEETTPNSVCGGLAGVVEGGLSNGMVAWVEFEDHGIAFCRLDSVWAVGEFAAVTNFDDVLSRQGGSGVKEEKGVEVAHFDIDSEVRLLNTVNVQRTGLQILEDLEP